MISVYVLLGLYGFFGLALTTVYETWLGVSLREASMTRILFGASVSLKVLLIVTLGYVLYAIQHPTGLTTTLFGHTVREYMRVVLYGGLALQVTSVTVALFRWDRRAMKSTTHKAEQKLVARQQELHDKLDKHGIQ